MDGGDDALLSYRCLTLQLPLVYATNQTGDYYRIVTANIRANRMTRRQEGNRGKCNSLRESWKGIDPWDIFPYFEYRTVYSRNMSRMDFLKR
jgi:hypothetical protein